MFSSRFHWKLQANRISELVTAIRREGAEILDLTESNPTAAGLVYDRVAITNALAKESSLHYDPAPFGLEVARTAIAEYYGQRRQKVPIDRIILTASTSEAYAYLFKLLCDAGDEVLVPRPSYPLFDFLAQLELVRISQYPLFYDHGWHLDAHDLAGRITPRTRAIVVVNPNNPTGSFLKRGELAQVWELCLRHDLAIIADEVFADYPFAEDPDRVTAAAIDAPVLSFSLGGLSKAAGLPQLKLGWTVLGGNNTQVSAALDRLEVIADTYLSVSTSVQTAARELLRSGASVCAQIRQRTRQNLAYLRQAIRGSTVGLLQLEGGWYAILQVARVRSEEEWVLTLVERQHTVTQPGYFYDFPSEAYLVVSLLTPEPIFAEGIRRLLALAREQ